MKRQMPPNPFYDRSAEEAFWSFVLALFFGSLCALPSCASLQKDPFATADAAIALLQCAEPIVSELTRKREAAAKEEALKKLQAEGVK